MKNSDLGRSFRWNLTRGDRIGSLVEEFANPRKDDGETLRAHERYNTASPTRARSWSARQVLARSVDGDLYFVGRSPDSVFDLLSGVLYDTPDLDRLHRLPLSLYGMEGARVTLEDRARLRGHLSAHGVTPREPGIPVDSGLRTSPVSETVRRSRTADLSETGSGSTQVTWVAVFPRSQKRRAERRELNEPRTGATSEVTTTRTGMRSLAFSWPTLLMLSLFETPRARTWRLFASRSRRGMPSFATTRVSTAS